MKISDSHNHEEDDDDEENEGSNEEGDQDEDDDDDSRNDEEGSEEDINDSEDDDDDLNIMFLEVDTPVEEKMFQETPLITDGKYLYAISMNFTEEEIEKAND